MRSETIDDFSKEYLLKKLSKNKSLDKDNINCILEKIYKYIEVLDFNYYGDNKHFKELGVIIDRIEEEHFIDSICNKEYYELPNNLLRDNCQCRVCSIKSGKITDKEFKDYISKITNKEYKAISDYYNDSSAIQMKHIKCENKFAIKPINFIENAKCPNCNKEKILSKNDYKWNKKYNLAKEYYEEHGTLLIPANTIYKDVSLGNWVLIQRDLERKNKLSIEKKQQLNKIGMIWGRLIDIQWEKIYELAKEYYNKNGNLLIPYRYAIDNVRLGAWITQQRIEYKKNKMSKYRIDKLENIKINWTVELKVQTSFPEQAIYYYMKKYFNDAINRYTDLGFELDIFIPSLKLGIEYDGQAFHNSKHMKKDIEKNNKCLEKGITLIRIREPKCPSLNSSSLDFILKNKKNIELDNAIKFIVNYINVNHNYNFKTKTINVEKDNFEIYDIYSHCINREWYEKYNLAKKYFKKNGDLLIPQDYTYNGIAVGVWLCKQRLSYKENKLNNEYISKLEKIGMIWDIYEFQWNEYYKLAKKYFRKNGNLLIPTAYIDNNLKLGVWVSKQRSSFKSNNLSQARIDKLNDINMIWNNDNAIWDERYKLAKEYFKLKGHLLMPSTYVVNDIKLGAWVAVQKNFRKTNKLKEDRFNKLNKINMNWN